MCGPHANSQVAPVPTLEQPTASLDVLDEDAGCGSEGVEPLATQGDRLPNLGGAVTDFATASSGPPTLRLRPYALTQFPAAATQNLGSLHTLQLDRPPR